MTDLSPDCELERLMKPLFEDETSTAHRSARKTSYDGLSDFTVKYKTEKCRYWLSSGACPFGLTCAFAHGDLEMREKIHIAPNYKTKPCINFQMTGTCKYGDRCQFLHKTAKKNSSNILADKIEDRTPEKTQQSSSNGSGSGTTDTRSTGNKFRDYSKLLDSISDSVLSDSVLPRRLKVFQQLEEDNFDKVDWKFKKTRLYSM